MYVSPEMASALANAGIAVSQLAVAGAQARSARRVAQSQAAYVAPVHVPAPAPRGMQLRPEVVLPIVFALGVAGILMLRQKRDKPREKRA